MDQKDFEAALADINEATAKPVEGEIVVVAFARLSEWQRQTGQTLAWSLGRSSAGWTVRLKDGHGNWFEATDENLTLAAGRLGDQLVGGRPG